MLTQTIRRQFLQYFKDHQHAVIPSSSVVPHDDPTLLFINAGMNQFKDVFLGNSHRDYKRAATSQKCIRVGGKHNDLENVGHTSRHLTFFEMLGNFSFGDYFKAQAIQFAWEVSTKIFGFEPDRIWPTVFREDDEAFEIWTQYVPAERITRFGEKENFWAMGDTGPCGPCSELLYDRGSHFGKASKPIEDTDGERFLEFWNLVFMQFNRQPSGEKEPLPKPSIDTGAGLERVISLKMGVDSLFETDVLRSIIAQVESITGLPYHPNDNRAPAFRVIADHLRCLAFAIADGVQPSNVDRGYVLRKVLRRAVRYGRQLGMDRPFLADVLPQLVSTMGSDYPELIKGQQRIAEILTIEEEAFIRTLKRGGNILNQVIEKAQASDRVISGDDAFKLKDTYGLPLEEILLIAKDSDLSLDQPRYQQLEEEAKQRSRSVHKSVHQIAGENIFADFVKQNGETKFLGYTHALADSKVLGLVVEGQFVSQLEEGQEALVILSETPFYAEMGGQVGDTGALENALSSFTVVDCIAPYKGLIAHQGKLEKGSLKVGDTVTASIDRERRQKIANNHTATHLLHWALHRVLGEHVKQAGSVVDAQRLRFDFSHHKALTLDELRHIEDLVNEKIRENAPVKYYEIKYEEAQKRDDIKQFFGEKYGSSVRVIDIDYSKELCGGTHTSAVGNIGLFRIAKESSIAAGIRRIEAVTGQEAEMLQRQEEDTLIHVAQLLKVPSHQIEERLSKLLEENKQFAQEIKELKKNQLNTLVDSLLAQADKTSQLPMVIAEVSGSIEELRFCLDLLSARFSSGAIVLGTALPDKCQLMAKVSDDWVKKGVSAHEIIKAIMPIVEGSGGGKQQAAQGGGKAPQKLLEALQHAKDYLLKVSGS
ncbi:alanine--tRNA ligase [Candidatus Protochlamydia phocaeensis]|uniref:alanine--tRNA ligase n=1 Tax=Candidatus Protochlamydia phocaeensis TaxID=1414722 RepID=UPI0008389F27|nr:alanine--tRNA ligase [Candidatus Protochlamydia phocaeensis]